MKFFTTGIGTNVGKTIASAIIVEALQADYWKPVQSGSEEETSDSELVKALISNSISQIHKEAYVFKAPLSPHQAAKLENVSIDMDTIELPLTKNNLVIEGAGGILVPLNDKNYTIDLAKKFDAEVIIVVTNYLGCINHSLLSIDYLSNNGFKVAGLILNGDFDAEVEKAICNYKNVKVIGKIPHSEMIDKQFIIEQAKKIKILNAGKKK